MRILVVDTGSRFNAFGGQQRIAAVLYRGLSKSNETYYLGYATDYMKDGKTGSKFFIRGVSGSQKELRKSWISENALVRIGYNMAFSRTLAGMDKPSVKEWVRKMKPDIIIANSISDFALLSYLRRSGISFKSVYIDHGSLSTTTGSYISKESIPLTFGSGINSMSVDGAKRKFFNFFDMNVALNVKHEKEIARFTDKVTRISNGIGINTKVGAAEKASLMAKCAITPRSFVVIYIGRLFERQKRVSTLIKAFKAIDSSEARLLLAGSGPSLEDYKELAEEDSRIIFCGALSGREVAAAYAISNIFVLPSAWEGLGLTVLEALQFGLPIILSDDAYSDDLKVGSARLLHFPTGDVDALASLIDELIREPDLRKRAALASLRLSKEFSEEKMLRNYESLLKKLDGRKR